ncbi:MAG: putative replicase protein [Alehxovirus pseudonemorisadaptatum]|uniref:RNA-directed RNA polymerase n=1 Tax=Leviviridae sp. TaxID=2027243 RepID=A0ABY3SSB6_9VIRU|nr:MAG: putative replicase protein [Leviviridae sp.]
MKDSGMKSYVRYLQGLYKAMFLDIAERIPTLQTDCRRDTTRLLSLVESRGLPFLTIDLPDAGKAFDRSLSDGRLNLKGIPGQREYKRGSNVPRLFKGLYLRVFDEYGVLRSDPDVMSIRFLRQLFTAAKKVKIECDDSRTWEHVNEFFRTDLEVRFPTLNWDEDELRIDRIRDLHFGDPCYVSPAPLFDDFSFDVIETDESSSKLDADSAETIQRIADAVSASLGVFKPLEWRAKHGPGAVSDLDRTSFKYDFPYWSDKLERVFPMADFAFANYACWADDVSQERARYLINSEPPSKLIAVPKTQRGPRLIASEPTMHQWCQQTIKDFLATRSAYTPLADCISFRDQTPNQRYALRASHAESHWTVDLSSASDRLSCWVVERTFRMLPSLVSALHSSRTRWVYNSIDRKSPQYHVLRKFACMGSACTFPVQTYVFAILAVSSVIITRGSTVSLRTIRQAAREVQVFGDDIIVPIDCGVTLQGLLTSLGLRVNHNKTFGKGKFRESCGVDAYDGTDVTPTYSMTYPDVSRPESIASCVETSNNFYSRGYFRTAQYVKSTVDSLRRYRLPNLPVGSGAFGWKHGMEWDNTHLKRRYNPVLHRVEYLVDALRSKVTRSSSNGNSTLLQYFSEVQRPPLIKEERLGVVRSLSTSIRRRWEPIIQ